MERVAAKQPLQQSLLQSTQLFFAVVCTDDYDSSTRVHQTRTKNTRRESHFSSAARTNLEDDKLWSRPTGLFACGGAVFAVLPEKEESPFSQLS